MLKLIQLEIKKFKLFGLYKSVLIANVALVAFMYMIYYVEIYEGNIPFTDFDMAMDIASACVRATFTIFAAVLIVKLVIDEYKNKSIEIMFTYPINRKKIMAAKLAIVVLFTFSTVLSSLILMEVAFYTMDLTFNIIPGSITLNDLLSHLFKNVFDAAATAGLSLIPLLFGLPRKSTSATLVAAIFLTALTSSTSNDVNLFSTMTVPVLLGAFGLFIGYVSIKNIEKTDVIA